MLQLEHIISDICYPKQELIVSEADRMKPVSIAICETTSGRSPPARNLIISFAYM